MSRACGSCTLCCKLVPVAELGKKAGDRCVHQSSSKGCTIYATRPSSCRVWSCQWLFDPGASFGRPDRTHYVVDCQYDVIRMMPHDGGEPIELEAVQVWVDPAFPDAWRDPALLRYLDGQARQKGAAALLRYGSLQARALFAPGLHPSDEAGDEWVLFPMDGVKRDFGRYASLPEHERPIL